MERKKEEKSCETRHDDETKDRHQRLQYHKRKLIERHLKFIDRLCFSTEKPPLHNIKNIPVTLVKKKKRIN
jgi:hypothetical protein